MDNAVKAIIVNSNDEILILEQVVHGNIYYSLPGGRIKGDVNEINELQREIQEETGLNFTDCKSVGKYFFERTDGSKTSCNAYLIREYSGELNSENKEEYEDIKHVWMNPQEFIEKYADSESLKGLIKGLIESGELKELKNSLKEEKNK